MADSCMPRLLVLVCLALTLVPAAVQAAGSWPPTYPDLEPWCYAVPDFENENLPNFIGSNGTFWYGPKSPQAAAAVSWVDKCAKQLEACQTATSLAAGTPDPNCVCAMWDCLHPPPGAPPVYRPYCAWATPVLQYYYCNLAKQISASCSGPVPIPEVCPILPPAGETFDSVAPGALTNLNNLQYTSASVANSDDIVANGGPYDGVVSGMISRSNVATIAHDSYIIADAGYAIQLSGGYFTAFNMDTEILQIYGLVGEEPLWACAFYRLSRVPKHLYISAHQPNNVQDFCNGKAGDGDIGKPVEKILILTETKHVIIVDNLDISAVPVTKKGKTKTSGKRVLLEL